MAKNRVLGIYSETLEVAVPSGAKSGSPVLALGVIPAILQTDEGGGVGNIAGRATVECGGVWSLPCTDAVAAEGTKLYITASQVITTTSTSNTLFGYSVHVPAAGGARSGGTKASGAGNINVRLAKV